MGAKAERLNAIKESSAIYNSFRSKPLNILSIDVGIKNFSYAKLSYDKVKQKGRGVVLHDWNHVNLHNRFGDTSANSLKSLSKPYMAQIAVKVVDEILLGGKWEPSLILMESQRTRSNMNSATLPNVLLNYTLEHMIYAAYAARMTIPGKEAPIISTNSTKMVNFWINRFIEKDDRMSPSSISARLPSDFAELSFRKQTAAFIDSFSFECRPGKADDLIDCLLYNIASYSQLSHHYELQNYIKKEEDALPLLQSWDETHINYLKPLLEEFELKLKPEFIT
ncbi:hypothetical protein CXQ85_003531 [Candidozyma haemuli]|uniref:Mitochondrial resolvase Ydc2 catalytic domain-containing protein n=1 Tax=Candidozyma haemuli TaxID=45357 RepID=A0A2V1AP80_9ASCO|nr:hypothetical protein CXQ85_003531 [[Candida] haemuloni]PVH19679.1 hypothetical protein CXQ85_003531 [[Candida] haemuloni]